MFLGLTAITLSLWLRLKCYGAFDSGMACHATNSLDNLILKIGKVAVKILVFEIFLSNIGILAATNPNFFNQLLVFCHLTILRRCDQFSGSQMCISGSVMVYNIQSVTIFCLLMLTDMLCGQLKPFIHILLVVLMQTS